MAHNFEHAAISAFKALKSMSIDELSREVQSNVNEQLSITMRQLGYLNERGFHFSETHSYSFTKGRLSYSMPNKSLYKKFKAANVERYILLAS